MLRSKRHWGGTWEEGRSLAKAAARHHAFTGRTPFAMLEPNPTQEHALFSAPRGTGDILPEEQPYWQQAIETAEQLCRLFGYGRIDTPTFEQAELFERGAGEGSDVVRKEMYVFQDRSGERLALKPEGTASICRAYLQHGMSNLPQPVRLYSFYPAFRYERPQTGRRRQHFQFDCEAIGDGDAAIDAEVIEILWRLYADLGLRDLVLLLNSIGDRTCRPRYLEALREYYKPHLERSLPGLPRSLRTQSAASPRLQAGKLPAGDRGRPLDYQLSLRRLSQALRGPQALSGCPRHSVRADASPGSRARLLHAHSLRDPAARWRRAEHDRCRWPLRLPDRRAWRQSQRRQPASRPA